MELKYWQAINMALVAEMRRDPSVFLLGQDAGRPGGTFGSTRNLYKEFGPERVRDMPISEQAIVGAGIGAALVGLKPIVEILFMDFLMLGLEPLINQAAKYEFFSAGSVNVPVVIKTGVGTHFGMGAQHSQSLEAWYAHIPGLKVVWPSVAEDAYGLLISAIRDKGPVVFVESLGDYRTTSTVGGEESLPQVPMGVCRTVVTGEDLTIVTYGTAVATCLQAASELAKDGVKAEVIDLRTIVPWDKERVFASVRRTGRCLVVHDAVESFGVGGELVSEVAQGCWTELTSPPTRIGSTRTDSPQVRTYERARLPSVELVVVRAKGLVRGEGVSTMV